jgi:hypothetical protein
MAMVCATAATHYIQIWKPVLQAAILHSQLDGISNVEIGSFV